MRLTPSAVCLFTTTMIALATPPPPGSVGAPSFSIPRMDTIVIDGQDADWAGRGFRVDLVFPITAQGAPLSLKHVSDHDVRFRLGWDDQGLLILVNRRDDQWLEATELSKLGARDAIEIFVSPALGDPNICQWVVGPGMAEAHPDVRTHLFDHRTDPALQGLDAELTVVRSRIAADACVIEIRVPWKALGITPEAGRELAFQFWSRDVDDADDDDADDGSEYFASWFPGMGAYRDSTRMQRVVLAEAPSPALRARIQPRYNRSTRRPMVTILGAAELIDSTAEVRHEGRRMAAATLGVTETGHAAAELALPLAETGHYGDLDVFLDGARDARITADNGLAWERLSRLGPGINILGYYHPYWRDDKGPSLLRADHIAQIRHAGFQHVRLCLLNPHWFMDENLQLSEAWIRRVDWVIEQALAAGLHVILDLHAQGAHDDYERERRQLLAFWAQLSERYQTLPDSVLFEIMNEPHGSLTDDRWKRRWNRLQREAIEVIRRTNPRRTIVVTPAYWFPLSNLVHLELPADDRNLITAIHYYAPWSFTHQGADWLEGAPPIGTQWGTASEYQAVKDDFDAIRRWSERTGRPVILGEFGVMNVADAASRARWVAHVARTAEASGIPWSVWYFETGAMQLFNLETDAWDTVVMDALFPTE